MNLMTLPCLAVLPPHPSITQVLSFQFSGLLVVFIALCSIWVMVEITGRIFKRIERQSAQAKISAAALAPAPAPAPVATGPTPEVVAVIAAAIHVTLGPRARVTSVKPVQIDGDWAREGRRQIFASHHVR